MYSEFFLGDFRWSIAPTPSAGLWTRWLKAARSNLLVLHLHKEVRPDSRACLHTALCMLFSHVCVCVCSLPPPPEDAWFCFFLCTDVFPSSASSTWFSLAGAFTCFAWSEKENSESPVLLLFCRVQHWTRLAKSLSGSCLKERERDVVTSCYSTELIEKVTF